MMGVFYAQESARQRRLDKEDSGDGVEMSESNKTKKTPRERVGESRAAVGFALMMTTLILVTASWRYLSSISEPGRRMLQTVQQRGGLGNLTTNGLKTITVQKLGPAKRLPEPTAALSEDDKDRLNLIEWVRGMPGGYVADISFGSFDHSGHSVRGIKADSAFGPGDVIIKVPRSVFVSPNDLHLERYEWARELSKTGRKLPLDVMLSLRLQEIIADKEERMAPFIKLLPSKDDYEKFHPLMASDRDLKAYSDLPIVEDVKRKKGDMERIHRAMKLAGKFEDFWLAYVVTISRSYGVVYSPKKGSQKGSWVAESVPLVDMANTDEGSKINTVWGYNNRDGTFYLNATKKISPGDELLESYQVSSKKDNHFLAFMFGFMQDGNPKHVRQLTKARCDRLLSLNPPPAQGEGIRQLFHKLSKEHCQTSRGVASLSVRDRASNSKSEKK